jgi:uracil-DNA glycosylase
VTAKFDKEAWVAKLSDEQKDLLKLEIDTLDVSWLAHLKDDVTSPEFLNLKRFLKKEVDSGKKVFPPMEDVYSWSVSANQTDYERVLIQSCAGHDIHHSAQSRP